MSRNKPHGDGEEVGDGESPSDIGGKSAITQESTIGGTSNVDLSPGLQQEETRAEDQTTDLEVLAVTTTGPAYSAFSPWKKRYMCVFPNC